MEVTQHDAGLGVSIFALALIAFGFYVSRMVAHTQVVSEGIAQWPRWGWVQSPIIFEPPPALRQPQQTVLRGGECEVTITSSPERGIPQRHFMVCFADQIHFEFWLVSDTIAGIRYRPLKDAKQVSALGMLLEWSHPKQYALVKRFCEACLEEVEYRRFGPRR
ncbi:MAG: hypothetical protein KBE09_02495 [Candidatus Pacebacteria bacterium]|nr:hypothetical protein [Candidatus Paceibacterota bacterium]